MLTYSEQLLLLTVDPVSGRLFPIADQAFNLTLAGALLFEASFRGLINDDWKELKVINTDETGNLALDEAIWCLKVYERPVRLDRALSLVAAHGSTLYRLVRDSMQSAGLLTRKKRELIFYAQKEKLFIPDLPLVIDVHKKIRTTIIEDEIPDFQMPALISLMVAGGLTKYILKPDESARYKDKIAWLAGMEPLGREIIRSIHALESADIEKNTAVLMGMNPDMPLTFAGGVDSVLSSLSYLYKEAGISRSRKIIAGLNQEGGFACPGCAWPNPHKNRSHFEFCESGAKNMSSEATIKQAGPAFFSKWPVGDLRLTADSWLEQQGRLTHPMILYENSTHYQPIAWNDAFRVIAEELNSLSHPDEAVFYASGRTSIEAAFLFQLFARTLGTNNLASSANLCHEPSGKALDKSLGFGKGTVTLEDFPKADAIFVFGHNPGSNHPRMLKSFQEAARNGCRIVAVNPMPEVSLMGFADPQETGSWLGKQTRLADLYLQPLINGDMALIRGIAKAILESEAEQGSILDHAFIRDHTVGFESYKQTVMETSWEVLVSSSGVEKDQIIQAALIYSQARNVIATWCLGITHHINAVETVREIVNLLLLRGNIGKPGAGVCPVRGHSNIQGLRSAGVAENMPESFLEAMERHFQVKIPRTPGMSVIPAIRSMAVGKSKVLISLGGNLASAAPDTDYVHKALSSCRLTVMISTKLNRSHLVTGQKALILPCLSRSEEDVSDGERQSVTIEDAMGKVGYSRGCLSPSSKNLKSETAIIAGIAGSTFGEKKGIDWQRYGIDNQSIRSSLSAINQSFRDFTSGYPLKQGFYLDNPLSDRKFITNGMKAGFSDHPLDKVVAEEDELMLMTIRSHDQFNTSIFGLNDRYRGIRNERRVLFMNRADMDKRNISPEQIVRITSRYDGRERRLDGYYAIPYPIRQGCVAAYFPEANQLLSINNTCEECETPAYKSVRVMVGVPI